MLLGQTRTALKSFELRFLLCLSLFMVQPCLGFSETTGSVVLDLPSACADGRIPTLNKMGWVLPHLDPYSKAFVKEAATLQDPVLEIGAAYGFAVIEALKKGATVVANDWEVRHLNILEARVEDAYKPRLTLKAGRYPQEVFFPDHYFGAILAARLFVFFKGEDLEAAIEDMYRILKPGGKVFIVADSPYLKTWLRFRPIYEQRKTQGEPFPGFIEEPALYNPERAAQLPPYLHFLDREVLVRVLNQAGFVIKKVEYLNREDYPADVRLDGRECIAVVAIKPKR